MGKNKLLPPSRGRKIPAIVIILIGSAVVIPALSFLGMEIFVLPYIINDPDFTFVAALPFIFLLFGIFLIYLGFNIKKNKTLFKKSNNKK